MKFQKMKFHYNGQGRGPSLTCIIDYLKVILLLLFYNPLTG